MRLRTILVVAVALLAMTAMPAAAANASAVASEHTTFGTGSAGEPSPTQTTNMFINGSGESASVTLDAGTKIADSFEDGDLSEYSGATSDFDANTNGLVFDGSYSLKHTTNSWGSISDASDKREYLDQGEKMLFQTFVGSGNFSQTLFFVQNSTTFYLAEIDNSNNDLEIQKFNSTGAVSLAQTSVSVPDSTELRGNITVSTSGKITFSVTRESDNSDVGSVSVTNTAITDGGIGFRSGQDAVVWDNVRVLEGSVATGTYIGASHSAEKVTTGWANLTLTNASATVTWQEDADGDGTWANVTSTTYTSSGNKTVDLSSTASDRWRVRVDVNKTDIDPVADLHDEGLLFNASAPKLANPDPPDGANISSYDGDISINLNDTDFGLAQSDNVTVTATNSTGSTIGTTTATANGSVTFSYSPVAGENTIEWTANDSYGQSDSLTHTFTTPSTLYVRNESAPTNLVDGSTLDVTFYASNTSLQTTTSNGTVQLDGLPADERIVGVVNADGYYSRHIVIQSIFSQESVYLLDKNVSAVEDRFTLSDQSGQFEQDETAVLVKRPLTRDYDGDGANETRYETVAADQFGVAGYSLFLEEGVRYRIAVRDADDYQRLGPYTADVSETVELQPGEFRIAINDSAEGYYALGAYEEYQANGGKHQRLTFEYYDAANKTDQLEITVYQQGNASNQLEPTTTLQGPFGATSVNFNLTDAEANKTWVINWTADRGATTVGGEDVVGQNIQTQAASFPEWVQEAAAAATIILTLALFSRVNRETGAVTASMVGGGFWFAGWLPPEAGGAVVVALAVSLIFKTGIPEV